MSHSRANHVTPDELAARSGFSTQEILAICLRESVPVLHGRIDATLFELTRVRAGYEPGLESPAA